MNNEEQLPKVMIENGIRYVLDEQTQTYLPDFGEELPLVQIGRFGQMREKYLQEHYPATYFMMLLKNELTEHLIQIDEQAWEMEQSIVKAMAEQDGTNEELKRTNQLEWIGLMNNYRQAAEEIILKELIYV